MDKIAMLETIRTIEQAAAQNIVRMEGDYIDGDGMLICGKCNTPKQFRFEVLGEVLTPYCLCKCALEERERTNAVEKVKADQVRIAELRKAAFGGTDMEKWTFKADDCTNEKVSKICRKYVEKFDDMLKRGKGLLFYGGVGTGKTFYAACIANALIDKGRSCYMTNLMSIVNQPLEDKVKMMNDINKYSLLILDDLAAERDTQYMQESVVNLVDARYRSGKPIIVTTNLTATEMKYPADMRKERIYSRLFEMCIPIEVTGKDRRKEKLKKDFDEMRDILGV